MDIKDNAPSFQDVADFVRGWASVPARRSIMPDTLFERDLGITGDDGSELLEAAQERFKVNLTDGENGYRTIFKLGPNEYLFNSEGFSIGFGGTNIITLFSNADANPTIRSFTVGELCEAIQKAPSSENP